MHRQSKNVRSCQPRARAVPFLLPQPLRVRRCGSSDSAVLATRTWQKNENREDKCMLFSWPLLLPLSPGWKDSPLANFRGCAFKKRTGNELQEVTKPISSFLCQIRASLLTQQVKSRLFGTAPEVPDITASRKLASHAKRKLSS